jgi:hypothetical protein
VKNNLNFVSTVPQFIEGLNCYRKDGIINPGLRLGYQKDGIKDPRIPTMSGFDFAYGDDYSDEYGDEYGDDYGDNSLWGDYDDPDDWFSPLPKTAVYSGTESFKGNHELTEVTFAQGVTSIANETFWGCSSLTAITIPDGVTMIGDFAFHRCSSLTAITIPDGVTTIGYCAFCGCSSLTAITIPDGVTTIGEVAFSRCPSLTAITIPNGVTTIGHSTFWRCSSLTAITIPDGVTIIGERAFDGCSSLTKLILSPAVSIGEDCFSNCTALIIAAADKNMPTVSDLLHYRWHRNVAVIERVNALLCLKGSWDHVENQPSGPDSLKQNGVEAPLKRTEARDKIPKVLWRVILEFL